jgi:hypothetical protein
MSDEPDVYVLGAGIARANAEEQRAARERTGAGPLSPDIRYDRWAGDDSLADPVWNAVDARVRDVCRRFAASGAAERAKLTAATSMDDFYTLIHFAKRCAAFAMRAGDVGYVADGSSAIAMIDARRIDRRDALPPLALLEHAARAVGASPDVLFAAAAKLAQPEMQEGIESFARRPDRDIREWGYAVVETAGGAGFVDANAEPYDPTVPLDRLALALADVIGADDYERGRVSIADDLPAVWLQGIDDAALARALGSVRAGVTIHASLRPGVAADEGRDARGIIVFFIELGDESSAESLLRIADAKSKMPSDIALMGIRAARLFALVVARSFVTGVKGVETSERLRRFTPRFAAILAS